jgi:hypothetical protein
MVTGSTLFDVVIFGCDLEGAKREAAKQKLARLCKCEPHETEKLLRTGGMLLKRGITEDEARQLQQVLVDIGIRCNYRPSQASGIALELVPINEEDLPIICPACGHNHPSAPDGPKPDICENCGVVFSKYEKVSQIKLEREQIKRRLMEAHQRSLTEQTAEQKRREEEERRKRLEEEIRRELGLPRFVTSRRGIISSAAVIFGLGLSLGAAIVFLAQHDWDSTAHEPGLNADVLAQLDPAISAHIQASTLLGGSPGFMDRLMSGDSSDDSPEASDGSKPPVKTALVSDMLTELSTDAEWDRFLSSRIDALVAKNAIAPALELVEHLRSPQARVGQGARLAESLAKNGKQPEAEKLFNRLANFAETLAGGETARVEALCEIARHQAYPEVNLATAQLIVDHIAVPADKAVAEVELGSARMTSNSGAETAYAAFARANQAIAQITDHTERAFTVARTARSYAKTGSRGGAASLLEDVMKAVGSLPGGDGRNGVLNEMIQAYAEIGDTDSALKTADLIGPPAARDKAIYGLVVAEITRGRLAEAMETAETIKNPAYQARALGFLGLAQQEQALYRTVAPVSFEQARQAAESLANPTERLAVFSEIARYASRDPDNRLADPLFAEAEKLASALANPADRDSAQAIMAANHARALRFADADKKLAEVRDPGLVQSLGQDLAEIKAAGTLAKP